MSRNEKRKRDTFSITIPGMIIICVSLILIIVGSYIGAKTLLKNKEERDILAAARMKLEEEAAAKEQAELAGKEQEQEEEEKKKAEEKAAQEALEEQEAKVDEHEMDISKIVDEEGKVDYGKILFKPGKSDPTLSWSDEVFVSLENLDDPKSAGVNSLIQSKVSFYTVEGKKIALYAYSEPESGVIVKIREVTYTPDTSDITEYYYKNGKLNYSIQYSSFGDIPVDISGGIVSSRYYFRNDCMLKYLYCKDGVATEYNIKELENYSEGTVGNYEYLEGSIINMAYIDYNLAKQLDHVMPIKGYVFDQYTGVADNATIIVTSETTGDRIAEGVTTEDGTYEIDVPVSEDKYAVWITKEPYGPASIHNISAVDGTGAYYPEVVYMSTDETAYDEAIFLRDPWEPTKQFGVASIKIMEGYNNPEGIVLAEGVTNELGALVMPLKAGCYTAKAVKDGYYDSYFNVTVYKDSNMVIGYMVPKYDDDKYTVLATWKPEGLDLDLRAISSYGKRHIIANYDSKGETAEVMKIENSSNDVFKLYLYDFTDCVGGDYGSYNMSNGRASITVYSKDGLIDMISVPPGQGGVVWEAFSLYNNKIVPINNLMYTIGSEPFWTTKP